MLSLWLLPAHCLGGGILHVLPPTLQEEAFAVARPTVLRSRNLVTVSEGSIEYRQDQTFYNDNEFPLEGVFLLPLGTAGSMVKPDVRINGVPHPASVLSADEFFPLLKQLTVAVRDPSLLYLAGKDVLLVRPVNIEVRGQKSFRVQYAVPASIQDDFLEMTVPLDGERYSLGPVGEMEINVRFKMNRPLRSVFSPTHHFELTREAPHRGMMVSRSEGNRIKEDLRVLATFSRDELDLKLFAHRSPQLKGAFMGFLSPPVIQAGDKPTDKDVVFLLDCSGSMGRTNLELAKQAVTAGLEKLRAKDRFSVITIGTRVSGLSDRLLQATPDNLMKAVRFVNSTEVGGGTDLYNGLASALELFSSRRRPCIVLLAGDGRGTVGITAADALVENVRRINKHGARVFALAMGEAADVAILDKVARVTRGTLVHFSGKEPFETAVRKFLVGISAPAVSQIGLDFQNIKVEDVIPETVPDLFEQDSAVVLGRFTDDQEGSSRVRLRARIAGRPKGVNRTIRFPEPEYARPYISEIWAMRRIAQLMEQEWLKGTEPETTDRIASLAGEFGFKTPRSSSRVDGDAAGLFWLFKTSFVPSEVESNLFRRTEGKVFRLDKNVWTDTQFTTTMPVRTVRFLSGEYFALLGKDPRLGGYFSIGPEVVAVLPQGALRITAAP